MGQCVLLVMMCYRDVEFIKQFLGKGNIPVSRNDVQGQGVSRRSGYTKTPWTTMVSFCVGLKIHSKIVCALQQMALKEKERRSPGSQS